MGATLRCQTLPTEADVIRTAFWSTMDYVIGIALVTSAFAAMAGFDRDRVFYPTLLVAIASYLRALCRRERVRSRDAG